MLERILPHDITASIFEYVISSDESLSIRHVCKTWKEIIDEKTMELFIRHFTNEIDQIPKDFKLRAFIQEVINSDSVNLVKFLKINHRVKKVLGSNLPFANVPQINELYRVREYNLKILWNELKKHAFSSPEMEILESCDEISNWMQQSNELVPRIDRLNLNGKKITHLPSEIGLFTGLQEFFLSGNQLTYLPKEIASLVNLKTLFISDNQLTDLPPEFIKLKKLDHLFAFNNLFKKFPPEILSLTNLQQLWLLNNKIEELPEEICALSKLNTLRINNNPMKQIPYEVKKKLPNTSFVI